MILRKILRADGNVLDYGPKVGIERRAVRQQTLKPHNLVIRRLNLIAQSALGVRHEFARVVGFADEKVGLCAGVGHNSIAFLIIATVSGVRSCCGVQRNTIQP